MPGNNINSVFKIVDFGGWGYGSVVKSTSCSSGGSGFDSQDPCGG